MFVKNIPLIILLILFTSSFTMPIIKKNKYVKALSLLSMTISSILSTYLLIYVNNGNHFIYRVGHWDAPWGIEFKIGNLEALMSLLFTCVSMLVIWYSIDAIEKEIKDKKVPYYYVLINILIGSLLGIVYSNDLFNCFVFIETSTLSSCGIISIKDKKENIKATLKYLILSCMGSGLFLMAIAFIYSITGNLNISYIHKELSVSYSSYPDITLISLGLFIIGLGVKSAMFPLHSWLPDAHSNAPTTSSAILSSLVLKGFVFLLIKIFYRLFGIDIISQYLVLPTILVFGCTGMIVGSILAIMQKNIKKVVAYSSYAQMGYIFLGIGLGNELGLIMALFHIIGHAVTKSSLFLVSGYFIEQTGCKDLREFKGIGKDMPITLGLFSVAALSMVGIPILPGFISKWYLAIASMNEKYYIVIILILISSLLNAIYYLPIIIKGYFGIHDTSINISKVKEKSFKILLPVFILVTCIVIVGLTSNTIIEIITSGLISF